jgi:hypothetical protein
MGVVKSKKTNTTTDTPPSDSLNSKGIGAATGIMSAVGGTPTPSVSVKENPDLAKWKEDAMWSQPAWLANLPARPTKSVDKNYEEYLQNSLRWRYMRLEGDFRTALNNFYGQPYFDNVTALRVVDFLQSAKMTLEQAEFDTLGAKNLLDMIDQYMVWLYPAHVAFPQADALLSDLKAQNHPLALYLESQIAKSGGTDLDIIRATLDKVRDTLNQENQMGQLNKGLQIERLKLLMRWGRIFLILLLAILPMIVKSDVKIFDGTALGKLMPDIQPWFSILTVGIIGATGAFLSGLMQVRRSKVTLDEFRENVVQFKLRPLVGAIFAVIIAALLSWDLIAGIDITNAGVYVLIAFLCGFSERFFLGLLQLDEDGNSTREAGTPIVAANAKVITPN